MDEATELRDRRDGECPKRPAGDDELDFVRRPMVRWLDPHQLINTAGQVLASGFSTSYTDSRQMQGLSPFEVEDRSDRDELWIDYVSDLGDGWNSTFSVASLLVRNDLEVSYGGELHHLERGSLLILGGDQVYPVARGTEYNNRFLGPYRAAMPCPPPGSAPELFAIPGSHDWYDGLVNFTNIFCRQRPIGGWTTAQTRSYFAIRLPHRWWLWGIDLQFGDYLDEPQMAYFRHVAQDVEPGDQIVLCMAKEVESGRKSAEVCSTRDLTDLEREVVKPARARIALYLKSGRHHYARFTAENGETQLVTAGGGGAFLHPTHDVPEVATPPSEEAAAPLRRAAVYPSADGSRRLRRRIWLLPAYNLPLAAVLGALQVVVVFMLTLHLDDRHRNLGFADLGEALWESPIGFLLIILVIATFGAMIRLAHEAKALPRLLIGLGHSALQFGGLGALIVVASRLTSELGGATSLFAFLGLVWVVGGVGGVLGVSGYLWVTNLLGYHGNEAYAALHHMDQKNFLRLHIDASGSLALYPIGIERVGRRWRFAPDAALHEPWLVPVDDGPRPHLIESPVRLAGPNAAAH
ncbi:MAG: hypothetical protein M3N00_07555 [Actinomycetota bacterium]|nr:hypothetical protein [Actinomycetota bacterium]